MRVISKHINNRAQLYISKLASDVQSTGAHTVGKLGQSQTNQKANQSGFDWLVERSNAWIRLIQNNQEEKKSHSKRVFERNLLKKSYCVESEIV